VNLAIRLLKVILLFFLKGPRRGGLLDEYRVRFRVWPNDLDTNGHMNNGRYLTLLDLGRLDLLLRTGAFKVVFRRKWYPVLGSCQIRFRKPLNLFQKFEIATRIAGWDEKWILIEQRMIRDGRTVTHAYLKGVFVGSQGTVPISQVLEKMGVTQAAPELPPAFTAWLAAEREMAQVKLD
jgi:YbgC/YbaW family acyl-CoA thioester hydrolase